MRAFMAQEDGRHSFSRGPFEQVEMYGRAMHFAIICPIYVLAFVHSITMCGISQCLAYLRSRIRPIGLPGAHWTGSLGSCTMMFLGAGQAH